MTVFPQDERPVDLGGLPTEEGVSAHDAAERAEVEPDEQQNRRDPVWRDEGSADD